MTPYCQKIQPTAEVIVVTALAGCDGVRCCVLPIKLVRVDPDKWVVRCTISYEEALAILSANWRITRNSRQLCLVTESKESAIHRGVPESWIRFRNFPSGSIISTQEEWATLWMACDFQTFRTLPERKVYCGFLIATQEELPHEYTAAADGNIDMRKNSESAHDTAHKETTGLSPSAARFKPHPVAHLSSIISTTVGSLGQKVAEEIRPNEPPSRDINSGGATADPARVLPNDAIDSATGHQNDQSSPGAQVSSIAPGASFASGLIASLQAASASRSGGEAIASTLLRVFDQVKTDLQDVADGMARQATSTHTHAETSTLLDDHPRTSTGLAPSSRMAAASSSRSSSPILSYQAQLPPLTPVATSLSSCRFSAWYPPLRQISPTATIIDVVSLQPDFFQWLEEDGLILPMGSGTGVVGGEGEVEDEDDDEQISEGGLQPRDFSLLDRRIRQVIEKYDGEVFPKLDWSAPRDAAWMLPGQTLKCTTPADIYLLLKSSDFVGKDLTQMDELNGISIAQDKSINGTKDGLSAPKPSTAVAGATQSAASSLGELRLNLVLKRYFIVAPSHEFRCFVRGGQFVAICQRDGTYYDFLQAEETSKEIRLKLFNFWQQNLKDTIPKHDELRAANIPSQDATGEALQDYIWDAYFNRDRSKVFLMDVNPFLPRTDTLSWDWEELENLAEEAWRREHKGTTTIPTYGPAVRPQQPTHGPTTNGSRNEEDEEGTEIGSSSSSFDKLPLLRLLTSEAQASQSFPAYASNMVPRDVVDVSDGRVIEDFAEVWKGELEQAHGGREGEEDAADEAVSGDEGDFEPLSPSDGVSDVSEGGWCLCKSYDADVAGHIEATPRASALADPFPAHHLNRYESVTTAQTTQEEGESALIEAFTEMLARSRDAAKAG